MTPSTLVVLPLAAGAALMAIRDRRVHSAALVAVAAAHAAFTAVLVGQDGPAEAWGGYLSVDPIGRLFLGIVSGLFALCAVYGLAYAPGGRDGPRRSYAPSLLFFLGSMTLVATTRHLGLLWVATEATTLASAPLIYADRTPRALEATWKYLIICSVGIALALLGTFFLAIAATGQAAAPVSLGLDELIARAHDLSIPWLRGAFLFVLVGYGTKMGLAPMHTWLPDAHSEAPSAVSALLSAALLLCAFLGILRIYQVAIAAGDAAFAGHLLVVLGLVSLVVAAAFIVTQTNYKRMLAFSSVEHMGILALGIGIGGGAVAGSLLHALNHSLAKALLFLAAGNVYAVYGTKTAGEVRGLLRRSPATGCLLVAGFLAIGGSPPFGLFLSELMVLDGAVSTGRYLVAAVYLGALAVAFIGMAVTVLAMVQGEPPEAGPVERAPILAVVPPAVLAVLVLTLGVWVPPALADLLQRAAALVGG